MLTAEEFSNYYLPVPEAGCWLWMKGFTRGGYGQIQHDGRTHRAHRFSYRLLVGIIPDGMWVLHKCDTPSCVNPDHLFLGTPMDNTKDMDKKDRRKSVGSPGEKNPNARLSKEQVEEIRTSGLTGVALARVYGVHPSHINLIRRGKAWGAEAPVPSNYRGSNRHTAKLSEDAVYEIRRKHAKGEAQSALALEYGVNPSSIRGIVKRIYWKHLPELEKRDE